MPAITITALADPVAIVHVPVNISQQHESRIYWSINNAHSLSEEFFNVTSNRIEIAVFASVELIESEWAPNDPEIRISKSWRVFEISSGDMGDTGNYDSPHLRFVSAPLARAGISILYQSSYFTDFLLVKEDDFDRAAIIFASQGWRVHNSDPPPPRRRSGLFSPAPSTSTRSSPSPPPTPIPSSPEITVLPSPIACVGFARASERTCDERIRRFIVWPERSLSEWKQQSRFAADDTGSTSDGEEDEVGRAMQRPFISYTRNEYGSSLVTEVKALRGMFPPGDLEEMEVQCAGELSAHYDEFDDESDSESDYNDDDKAEPLVVMPDGLEITHIDALVEGAPPTPPFSASETSSPGKKRLSLPLPASALSGDIPISWTRSAGTRAALPKSPCLVIHTDTDADSDRDRSGRKRCLQLDLRGVAEVHGQDAYHLDKSGLVTLFSEMLDSAQIKMLYSSTFHTANVLVEAADVSRARRLLKKGRM